MTKIILKRIAKKKDYTIGCLYVDGNFVCNTLEDTDRGLKNSDNVLYVKAHKIFGKTAVPVGNYKIEMTYSPKFKRVLPLLTNVKGFSGIRIHQGNFPTDTDGCILVGMNTFKGGVFRSEEKLNKLMELLKDKKDIEIEIK